MNETVMEQVITEPIIPLRQMEREALGLKPEDGEFTLLQAGEIINIAKVRRSMYLPGVEIPADVRPEEFYRLYSFPIENRYGAATATAVISRVSEMALLAEAYRMELRTIPDPK